MSDMTKSQMIDAQVYELRRAMAKEPGGVWLDLLAQAIDAYRAEVADKLNELAKQEFNLTCELGNARREIEGLKGDVKSAEASEEHKSQALGECRLELIAMRHERDDWKQDAATSETKLEKAIEERDAALKELKWTEAACQCKQTAIVEIGKVLDTVRNERDGALANLAEEKSFSKAMCLRGDRHVKKIVDLSQAMKRLQAQWNIPNYMMPGSLYPAPPSASTESNDSQRTFGDGKRPEHIAGDKTVISWLCCGLKHEFSPPKGGYWAHEACCRSCGSKTNINA